MLRQMRAFSQSWVSKIIGLLLILSFVGWGMDSSIRAEFNSNAVAEVGRSVLTTDMVQQGAEREAERLLPSMGNNVEALKQLRPLLAQNVVRQWLTNELKVRETKRIGLSVPDSVIKDMIRKYPSFQHDGKFSPDAFKNFLRTNNLNESSFLAMLRQDWSDTQLATIFSDHGYTLPAIEAAGAAFAQQQRQADIIELPYSAVKNVGTPSDGELEEFLETRRAQYSTPEYRDLTAVSFTAKNIAARAKVSEEELRDEYEKNLSAFQIPEGRVLNQLLFPDEKAAQAAYKAAKSAKSLSAAAASLKPPQKVIELGTLRANEMSDEIGKAVLSTSETGIIGPVKTDLGWHVLEIKKIVPQSTKSFDTVKNELRMAVQQRNAEEQIYKLANDVQDRLASGAKLEELAKEFDLSIYTVKGIDPDGKTKAGQPAILPVSDEKAFLAAAFRTPQGQDSGWQELKDGAYFVVRTDALEERRLKPMAQIRPAAIAAWQAEQQKFRAREDAVKAVKDLNAGESVGKIANQLNGKVSTSPLVGREDKSLNPRLMGQIFALQKGQAAMIETENGLTIAVLKKVVTPKIKPMTAAKGKNQAIQNDLLTEWVGALYELFNAREYPERLRQLFPAG
ncbi:MAG: peptidyl-prolyl cis-trans isomerase [Dongiaceae bacterium]